MSEKETKKSICHVGVDVVENGFKLCVCYKNEPSLSERAGWVPPSFGESKDYVAKTKADLKKQLEKIVDEM